jgi:diaminohydroxyphosphoribosylaminopyrimidine deaminase/5-amino-6-(5-phosphoribosylamino)uracil reductase
VRSILVEGGAEVFSSFLREGLWDKISVFTAPLILGAGRKSVDGPAVRRVAGALRLRDVSVKRLKDQILMEGYNVYGNY